MIRKNIVTHLILIIIFSFIALPVQAAKISEEENKKKLESVTQKIIFATMAQDVDALMKLTRLEGAFQSDKESIIKYKLRTNFFNKYFSANEIQPSMTQIDETGKTAQVIVKVHFTTVDNISGIASAPVAHVWNFVKGESGKERGEWILLLSK